MASSAKRRKARDPEPGLVQRGLASAGAFVSENPALVGGSTSFLVALLYVSANALWYQPHAHTGPFFATRSFDSFAAVERERQELQAEPQTTIHIERPETEPEVRRPLADPVVERVQASLKSQNFYVGDVDGLSGPATERAIRAFQEKNGLEATGKIDQPLLQHLGGEDTTGALAPASPEHIALVKTVQEGLRAFGSADIAVDGVMGNRTRNALKEFQSLFGLPEDGEPSEAVIEKMREAKFVR